MLRNLLLVYNIIFALGQVLWCHMPILQSHAVVGVRGVGFHCRQRDYHNTGSGSSLVCRDDRPTVTAAMFFASHVGRGCLFSAQGRPTQQKVGPMHVLLQTRLFLALSDMLMIR